MYGYYFYLDLQLKLRLLREWLKRMENKVPKLILRPKWTRETLDRRIASYKVSLFTTRWRTHVNVMTARWRLCMANARWRLRLF